LRCIGDAFKLIFMQNRAELYFIAAMMILILVGCAVACVAFFKTFKKEKAAREKRSADRKSKIES
jgi:flagellar basal body-associated protein FliL